MTEDVIHSYTAEDAIRDGLLWPVPEATAGEAGFNWPVRLSAGVVDLCTPSEANAAIGQDFEGRLWDVLTMARLGSVRAARGDSVVEFKVIVQHGRGRNRPLAQTYELWACVDGTSAPAIHIVMPGEY